MERPAPVRKSHTNTADLLAWPEGAQQGLADAATPPPNHRPHQPSEAIHKVVFGGQVTEEEHESLNKRKQCSAPKWKEMTGSGIFTAGGEVEEDESATPRTPSKNYQAISTISHISFAEDESVFPKKPTSIAEVAKQRELSGTLQSEDDSKLKKQISNAKSKELSGHDIFAPPEDPRPRNSENGSTSQTPGKNAQVSSIKFGEADDIFKADAAEAPSTAEKQLSDAKLKEMSGSNIFADGKAPARDFLGGIRKPPGGESSIALV